MFRSGLARKPRVKLLSMFGTQLSTHRRDERLSRPYPGFERWDCGVKKRDVLSFSIGLHVDVRRRKQFITGGQNASCRFKNVLVE
ncbi:hypothetical protein TNCV_573891 [Trichonephila clavipes]|nr:hypothetical protein TNCV_573891 [Trichonephila clavipes]